MTLLLGFVRLDEHCCGIVQALNWHFVVEGCPWVMNWKIAGSFLR
jgi:hypothetical protein